MDTSDDVGATQTACPHAVDGTLRWSKLRRMNAFRRLALCGLLLLASSCERKNRPVPNDSSVTRPAGTPDSTAATRVATWDASAGPLLLVQAESPARAFVLAPDSASARQA